jgi:hypothetical protein
MITRRLFRLPVVFALGLCGCSYRYHFDISGVVRSAGGQPLANVTIVLDPKGDGSAQEAEFKSAADGSFSHEMLISPPAFDDGRLPTRVLWFSKEGYVKEKVDISPKQKPGSYKEHIPVVVQLLLRKSQ